MSRYNIASVIRLTMLEDRQFTNAGVSINQPSNI
jgi:hypothetical protein